MSSGIRKRGLGRGLDALFQEINKDNETTRGTEENVQPITQQTTVKRTDEMMVASQEIKSNNAAKRLPVEQLAPGAFQPRRLFKDNAIDQLAESIAVHGVLQPLLVRPIGENKYEIIAGERRWRAAQKAKKHDVPVVIRELDDAQALEIGLIENLQREDLTTLEEAEGYQRLIDEFDHTQEKLAKQLGKSRSHIANTLRLLKLPIHVKSLMQSGVLSAGHARALIGASNASDLAGIIVKRGLNVRQTEKLVAQAADGKPVKAAKKKVFRKKDVDILALEEKMSSLLGLRVEVDNKDGAGQISIEYKNLDQLDDILERLSSVPK